MKRPDIAIIGICVTQALLIFIAFSACANGAAFPWLGTLIAVAGAGLLVYSTTAHRSAKNALGYATAGALICWAQMGPTAYMVIRSVVVNPRFLTPLIALIPVIFLTWVSIWVAVTHLRMRAIQKDNTPLQEP